MPRRPPPTRESLQIGDIVAYAEHSWDVVGRREEEGLPDHPPVVHIRLERVEHKALPSKFGAPRRFKRVAVSVEILERRAHLIGRQPTLFPDQEIGSQEHPYD